MLRAAPLAVLAAWLVAAVDPAAAQARLEPGEWEVTSSTEIPGSYMGPIERTERRCYTSSDRGIYADRDAWVKDMVEGQDAGCRAKDAKQDGTALSVTLLCDDELRVDLRHDFRGTTGTIDAAAARGSDPATKSRETLRRVADACSPETIESWKAWHPGKTFAP